MCKRNNSNLFFLCSLIEQLGRELHQKRGNVVEQLGNSNIQILYHNADVLHCEPLVKVAADTITEFSLKEGEFDNVARTKYAVPDVWTIGKVYARLIEDISNEENVLEILSAVYSSWIDEKISDFNSAFYYQPRDYIAECYRQGEVIDA